MRTQIIQAIKNFDINKLDNLLDDERSYMDVSKTLFLKTLEKKFKSAKKNGCNSFDDVFFGICESCNKGCEGMTFLSNSGYYLDIYMEDDNETVSDIYVCNKLVNFPDIEKLYDLGFRFCLDEAVLFKPDSEYTIISKEYKSLLEDIEHLEPNIKLDELVSWYNDYSHIRNFVAEIDIFLSFNYKLYTKVFSLISDINKITRIKTREHHAVDALINFQKTTTEREKLIWFFENETDHYGMYLFKLPKDLSLDSFVSFKSDNIQLTIDISGYEYVMDYFRKLDDFYDELMEKYKPLPEHYEQSPDGNVEYSLESFLKLRNVHLDVVEEYGRKEY